MDGFLIIDKPSGMTSHDVVLRVRRLLCLKRVGHTGTLDPMATGVLPICCGTATKEAAVISAGEKEYRAVLRLGLETDTGDIWGKIIRQEERDRPVSPELLDLTLNKFKGSIVQLTPAYSAVRYKGDPLHQWARRGVTVPPLPRQVVISHLSLLSRNETELTFLIRCSLGTYIRALLPDIAREFGHLGTVSGLRRLRAGPFAEAESTPLESLEAAVKSAADLDFTRLPGYVSLARVKHYAGH